ncbi:MAG TPA: hypothetical protein VNF71_02720 [Acidimicrobiales bacterium]|nr:hypothetical protein [Acidimicrobiales bacterium]
MNRFWPVGEPAQGDYEALRAAALAGLTPATPAAARFARVGLAGLIARPATLPVFVACLVGATRPAWSPYEDPRTQSLAAGYALLLGWADDPERLGSTACEDGLR